jgi:hypothetical protein
MKTARTDRSDIVRTRDFLTGLLLTTYISTSIVRIPLVEYRFCGIGDN